MAIEFKSGDIFESGAEALVNPVNTVGTMGKGLALAFKERFPGNFNFYRDACRRGDMRVGKVLPMQEKGVLIFNFPTKEHWRNPSRLEWVIDGLHDLRQLIEAAGVNSVAIPALGAGYGGLSWPEVRAAIERVMQGVQFQCIVYEPSGMGGS